MSLLFIISPQRNRKATGENRRLHKIFGCFNALLC